MDVTEIPVAVAEELARLRAENARLLKMLELSPRQAAPPGPAQAGRPLADRVRHTRLSNLKELRPGSAGRSEIRILYIYDPLRNAVLLVAGDKAGKWEAWYRQAIPLAEQRYEDYLKQEDIR